MTAVQSHLGSSHQQPKRSGGVAGERRQPSKSRFEHSGYRPFDAVDGDVNNAFTIHADHNISSGDDGLQVCLEKTCMIDHYLLSSQTADAAYRPHAFVLQRSDYGFVWADVDSVANDGSALEHYDGIPMTKVARTFRLS
ncbi:MAG: hypothetical protein M3O09_15490 [Acidobacteriota bacterium]|nr:hypothetical protein [Acidobacteriota bacterium]